MNEEDNIALNEGSEWTSSHMRIALASQLSHEQTGSNQVEYKSMLRHNLSGHYSQRQTIFDRVFGAL